jgi:hypothetical protein
MDENKKKQRRQKIRDFIDANSKSPVTGAVYALIYGPFGLIYTNPGRALVAVLVAVAAGLAYWPLIGLVWLGCVVMAPYQVRSYNARIRRSARFLVT